MSNSSKTLAETSNHWSAQVEKSGGLWIEQVASTSEQWQSTVSSSSKTLTETGNHWSTQVEKSGGIWIEQVASTSEQWQSTVSDLSKTLAETSNHWSAQVEKSSEKWSQTTHMVVEEAGNSWKQANVEAAEQLQTVGRELLNVLDAQSTKIGYDTRLIDAILCEADDIIEYRSIRTVEAEFLKINPDFGSEN